MDTDNHIAAEQVAEREALLCKAHEMANQSLKTEVSQFWKKIISYHHRWYLKGGMLKCTKN